MSAFDIAAVDIVAIVAGVSLVVAAVHLDNNNNDDSNNIPKTTTESSDNLGGQD